MYKEANANNYDLEKNKHIDAAGTVIVVLSTVLVCLTMTTIDDSRTWFKLSVDLMMAVCILYGLAANIIRYREIDKPVLVLTILYFCLRLISYKLNHVPVTFGGAFMLQVFYLIGINKYLFGGRQKIRIVLGTFIVFDVVIMVMNYYNYLFRPDYVESTMEKYALKGMLAGTNMFQSKNYAGMIAGAAVIICFAAMMNRKFERKTTLLLTPVIVINMIMIAFHSDCQSAQTGLAVIAILTAAVLAVRKLDSTRLVAGVALIACCMTLIPVYTLVYWKDNNEYICNHSDLELKFDDASTQRYAIWKTTILSSEGHELFGYGNNTTAWHQRQKLIHNAPPERTSERYQVSAVHKRQHNGYLALINEAGFAGAICFILLMLCRIRKFRGRFRDGQWEKLLLIYIFWLNLFEAKFNMQLFFSGMLMMVLLLPPEGEANESGE